MKESGEQRRRTLLLRGTAIALLLSSLAGVGWTQRMMDGSKSATGKIQETLYFSDGEWLRKLCLGYEGLIADIYWTRVVQYYGRKRIDEEVDFKLLGPMLRITTTLDPHLLIAYRFGALFLAQKPPAGPGQIDEALQLIRKGIVANPDYWRLWQDLGFIYYWDLKDYRKAAQMFEAGSRHPEAHDWMRVLAADLYARGGSRTTSQFLWSEIYRTAETEWIRKNAADHLLALQVDAEIQDLENLLAQFATAQGKRADSWGEVIEAGILGSVPEDPAGFPYTINEDGKVVMYFESPIDISLLR